MTSKGQPSPELTEFARIFFSHMEQVLYADSLLIMSHGASAWIHRSYPHFILFFGNKSHLTDHDVMIGRFLIYGWMPTILKKIGNRSEEDRFIKCLNNAKNSKTQTLSCRDLEFVTSQVNNSISGSSKLLHFVNPNVYAIFDSRVCYYLGEHASRLGFRKTMPVDKKQGCELYLKYLHIIEYLSTREEAVKGTEVATKQLGYQLGCYRLVEYVMYKFAKNLES